MENDFNFVRYINNNEQKTRMRTKEADALNYYVLDMYNLSLMVDVADSNPSPPPSSEQKEHSCPHPGKLDVISSLLKILKLKASFNK
jgi:hypothetical protein